MTDFETSSSGLIDLVNAAKGAALNTGAAVQAFSGFSAALQAVLKDMGGATSGANGTHGFVPAPLAGQQTYFLCADGTWKNVSGGGGTPGGSYGQIQYNNSGAFGGFTVSGDGTLATTTGVLTITKTNGVTFSTVATSGSAADLTGNLSVNRLNSGTSASSTTYWRGDGVWSAVVPGPAGSPGQIQYNSSGAMAGMPSMNGDATLTLANGVITVSKLNGNTVSIAGPLTFSGAYATTFTIAGATNVTFPTTGNLVATTGSPALYQLAIMSGSATITGLNNGTTGQVLVGGGGVGNPTWTTVPAAALPNPSASALGGVKSKAAISHNFLTSIGTDGSVGQAQPAASDISGLATSATTDTTNASNISSGTLPAGQLPALTGDVTTTAGTVATTVAKINGFNLQYLQFPTTGMLATTNDIPGDFTGVAHGLVPASSGGAVKYLRADGSWAIPAGSGTVTTTGSPAQYQLSVMSGASSITGIATGTTSQVLVGGGASANPSWGAVPAAALPNPSASTLGGVKSLAAVSHKFLTQIGTDGSVSQAQPAAADISDASAAGQAMLTAASAAAQTALLNAVVGDSGSGGTKGLVPAPASGDTAAGKYLKADGTWTVPPTGGAATSISVGGTGVSGGSTGYVLYNNGGTLDNVAIAVSNATPLMDGTATVGTSTNYAREGHIHPTDTSLAPLASPTLTGTPAAPTAAAGTNTTQIATTAFVQTTASTLSSAQGLVIKNNAGTPNTIIDVTAAAAVLTNSSGLPFFWNAGSTFTVDLGSNGAVNKLDTGTIASSTVYHVYLISNGTTTGGLASTSATSPTLPSGYTYYMRVGAMITDGSSHLYKTKQRGRATQYTNAPLRTLASGAQGNINTPTWVAIDLTGFIPATATRVRGSLFNVPGGAAMVAPNNTFGPYNATSCPTVLYSNASASANGVSFDYLLEGGLSTSLYYAGNNPSGALYAFGWEDAVNAC